MGEITVRAESAVLGLRPGEEIATEDSPYIRGVIAGGRLSLVEKPDDAASREAGPSPDTEARGKAGRTGPHAARERVQDAPEPKLRLKGTPEFDDAA